MSEKKMKAKALAFDETLRKIRDLQYQISYMESESGEYADEIGRMRALEYYMLDRYEEKME